MSRLDAHFGVLGDKFWTKPGISASLTRQSSVSADVHECTGNQSHTRQNIFDDIEMFCNPKRKHARNGMLSPVDFENRQPNVNQEGV